MKPASESMRVSAALLLSCLLHAALIFASDLGESSSLFQTAVPGGQNPEPARTLDATLVWENSRAFTVPKVTAEGEPRPGLNPALGIGLLPLAAPIYYTTDQLTEPARPVSPPELVAPESGPTYASGIVTLDLWISELGNVVSVKVEKTDLPESYTNMAAEAFRKLRFVPGEIDGRPVPARIRMEVIYDGGKRRR
jgi:outer membrane biosynthesis protein TonB